MDFDDEVRHGRVDVREFMDGIDLRKPIYSHFLRKRNDNHDVEQDGYLFTFGSKRGEEAWVCKTATFGKIYPLALSTATQSFDTRVVESMGTLSEIMSTLGRYTPMSFYNFARTPAQIVRDRIRDGTTFSRREMPSGSRAEFRSHSQASVWCVLTRGWWWARVCHIWPKTYIYIYVQMFIFTYVEYIDLLKQSYMYNC